MSKHGEWNHIEIAADDPARAQRFYEAVAGWKFQPAQGFEDYWTYVSGPGELGGGLGIRNKTAPAGIRNDVAVDSVDKAAAAAEANGGKVVTPKTDIGFGWYAAVLDSEGNEIGLYEAKPQS
jgi:predicted enzyme related to lactoylglutathione lyase